MNKNYKYISKLVLRKIMAVQFDGTNFKEIFSFSSSCNAQFEFKKGYLYFEGIKMKKGDYLYFYLNSSQTLYKSEANIFESNYVKAGEKSRVYEIMEKALKTLKKACNHCMDYDCGNCSTNEICEEINELFNEMEEKNEKL